MLKSHVAQSLEEPCSSVQKSHGAQFLRAQQLRRPCSPDLNKNLRARILKSHVAQSPEEPCSSVQKSHGAKFLKSPTAQQATYP